MTIDVRHGNTYPLKYNLQGVAVYTCLGCGKQVAITDQPSHMLNDCEMDWVAAVELGSDIQEFAAFIEWGTFVEIDRLNGMSPFWAWGQLKFDRVELGERVASMLTYDFYLD